MSERISEYPDGREGRREGGRGPATCGGPTSRAPPQHAMPPTVAAVRWNARARGARDARQRVLEMSLSAAVHACKSIAQTVRVIAGGVGCKGTKKEQRDRVQRRRGLMVTMVEV